MWTAATSLDDERMQPSDELIDLALRTAQRARSTHVPTLQERATTPKQRSWVNQWPGEHYRWLAALAEELQPRTIVEIGTFAGMGLLALKSGAPRTASLISYDIVDWREIPGRLLVEADFDDRTEQRLGDLSEPAYFRSQESVLSNADLIFIDGPKDGRFEPKFVDLLLPVLKPSTS